MTRIASKPVNIPDTVRVIMQDDAIIAHGKYGELKRNIPSSIKVFIDSGVVTVQKRVDTDEAASIAGLYRMLINNMINGVNEPFTKRLEISGAGYRVVMAKRNSSYDDDDRGDVIKLSLGYSHPIFYHLPIDVKVILEGTNVIILSSVNKELVGQIASNIRSLRPPDKYKGKGIRYTGEKVILKVSSKKKK